MPSYFLDEIATNDLHYIRAQDCPQLPDRYHRLYLGEYPNGRLALKKAALLRGNVNVCQECAGRELQRTQPTVAGLVLHKAPVRA